MFLAFHWHPHGRSPVTAPHLRAAVNAGWINLKKIHLPTGNVTLAAMLRCAITELGVVPIRPDWDGILTAASG